jgi:hypothetical protein
LLHVDPACRGGIIKEFSVDISAWKYQVGITRYAGQVKEASALTKKFTRIQK